MSESVSEMRSLKLPRLAWLCLCGGQTLLKYLVSVSKKKKKSAGLSRNRIHWAKRLRIFHSDMNSNCWVKRVSVRNLRNQISATAWLERIITIIQKGNFNISQIEIGKERRLCTWTGQLYKGFRWRLHSGSPGRAEAGSEAYKDWDRTMAAQRTRHSDPHSQSPCAWNHNDVKRKVAFALICTKRKHGLPTVAE